MLALNTNTNTNTKKRGCRSCGAYDNSQHQSCQPGRVVKQGRTRRAARDRRTSALILENARIQEYLLRGVS
jgi:hypothetical protein